MRTRKGIANPSGTARKLNQHRSTVEKHRLLLAVNILEKVPSLTRSDHISVRYKIQDNADELLNKIQEAYQKFYIFRLSGRLKL